MEDKCYGTKPNGTDQALAQRMARSNSRRTQRQRQEPVLLSYLPICLVGYDVDILLADTSARAFAAEAVEKVISHIKIAHRDALI
jgi:hypothetical protein